MGITVTVGLLIFGVFMGSYLISHVSIPVIKKVAEKKQLFDHPDQLRKIHTSAIPTFGGVAIFLAFMVSYSVSPFSEEFNGCSYFVGAILILFFAGLKDDLVTLSPVKKIGAQLIAAILVIFGCGVAITDFHGMLGINETPLWLGVPVSIFTIIVTINAVNLIDGIDGLAGGIGTLASLLFGTGFLLMGELSMAVFSFALAGALLGFMKYNFSPASIFMGDTGSMLIGFLLSVQAIRFLNLGVHPGFYDAFATVIPLLVVAILAFPLYDTLRVVVKRLRRGKSMFTPGQDHIHHELLSMGLSHKEASLVLYAKSMFMAVFAVLVSLLDVNINIQMAIIVSCCMVVYPTNGFKRRLLARYFNINWPAYQYKKSSVDIYYDNILTFNGRSTRETRMKEIHKANREGQRAVEAEDVAV